MNKSIKIIKKRLEYLKIYEKALIRYYKLHTNGYKKDSIALKLINDTYWEIYNCCYEIEKELNKLEKLI